MDFSRCVQLLLFVALLLVSPTGCRRFISPEEKARRAELRQALRERRFAAAVPLAHDVLQFAPDDDGAWARLAEAEAGLRDWNGLAQTLQQWKARIGSTSAKFDEVRGDLAFGRGDRKGALAAWTKSVSAPKPGNPNVFRKIARVEAQDRHWLQAAAAWTSALRLQESGRVHLERAIAYRHLHQWDAAKEDLRQAEKISPNDPVVRQERTVQMQLDKFLPAIRDLDRQLAALPDNPGLLGDRALLLLRAHAPQLAAEDAEKAAQAAPDAVRPRLFAAIAEAALGQSRAAGSSVRLPLPIEALSPEFLLAVRQLDEKISAEPANPEFRIARAWQLNEIAQPALALQDAERALQADPESAAAATEASFALTKLGRHEEAYQLIKRATDLDPSLATAWQYRGELEMQRHDYVAAVDALSRAIAISETAAALAKRAECYSKLGLLAKAADDRKVLEEFAGTADPK